MDFSLRTYLDPSIDLQETLIRRPEMDSDDLDAVISDVFSRVRDQKDQALIEFARKFDSVEISALRVSDEEIEAASDNISQELISAIDVAYGNIHRFHKSQLLQEERTETTPGVHCWREARPVERVGFYIPGGTAPLFSTVLMLGIPAQIAGCKEKVLCSPPRKDGTIHPAILYTAAKCGIRHIFKAGGAQAIAAMAIGTESIPPVYKIFGPGNQYVTAAKLKARDFGIAIDLPAGPSEVLVFADRTANPAFVAADLLSQAEHGPDSQVVLVTTYDKMISEVDKELNRQLPHLPRKDVARAALENGFSVVFSSAETAFHFINRYAPEHFIISSDEAERCIPFITNAGSVFLGHLTPESAGDYASGTNHTLPTSAYARSYSGVSLDSFVKKITFQKMDKKGLVELGPVITEMAEAEELQAHAQAVRIRLKSL
jgi:histidinol dehydrogenase